MRLKELRRWLFINDGMIKDTKASYEIHTVTESTAKQLLPFLQDSPENPTSPSPLSMFRHWYKEGSRGIVIPVGGGSQAVRFAGHLIVSLRVVLDCQLPIEIHYAGEEDLSRENRDRLSALSGATDITFVDVLNVFDDTSLKLGEGGWAIKAFAVLASGFEEVILVDADAVFLQKPDVLFEQEGYIDKGAYLFHDRLLWQHSFTERHDWWKDQIKEPSSEMLKSLVWTDDYAEECDSGVVVIDKSRLDVYIGLLHVAWQNTLDVREEVTYRMTHGDKESWWLGFELGGSPYEFEAHYGSMIGWAADNSTGFNVTNVCSFVIAHVDQDDRLLWYNGSLLKNKRVDPEGYSVPEYWMTDGKWHKGATKDDMSCMSGRRAVPLTEGEKTILRRSIELAKDVDLAGKGGEDWV